MTPDEQELIRARQRGRSLVTAWILGGLVVLFFAIAVVKISAGAAG